jgi:hypothetical protein
MDPNLFHLDWERVFEVLATIIVLAFFVERALAVLFESRLWLGTRYGLRMDQSVGKEAVAVLLSAAVCWWLKFDAPAIIVLQERTTPWGMLLTGLVVAGGSKASIKLFRDVLDTRSSLSKEVDQAAKGRRTVKLNLPDEQVPAGAKP